MDNYFLNTPVYKIWIDVIDIVLPTFSELMLTNSYLAGDVVCNRSGVHFLYSNKEKTLELYYSQPNKKVYCILRNKVSQGLIPWENSRGIELMNKELVTKEDLIQLIKEWQIFIKEYLL